MVLAVDFLTSNQYLVDGIGVRAAACDLVIKDPKQMFYSRYVVYVFVRDPVITFAKKGRG